MIVIDKDSFEKEVIQSELPVVVDLWGPQCGPCLALMPDVEKLSQEMEGKVKFCKLNVAENRRMAITLKVMSVPAILFYKNGAEVTRVVGGDVSLDSIRKNAEALLA